jgi:hypothetical protein
MCQFETVMAVAEHALPYLTLECSAMDIARLLWYAKRSVDARLEPLGTVW